MDRADLIALTSGLALVFAAPASAQTPPSGERQPPPSDVVTAQALPPSDPDPGDLARYEKRLEAWGVQYSDWLDQNAVALALSIPEEAERLHIMNTSNTGVVCAVHRSGTPTGRTLQVPSGSAVYIDGLPAGTEDSPPASTYIPINQIQLRCPLVAGNRVYGNFRVGGRYAIQRVVSTGGLELVEVVP